MPVAFAASSLMNRLFFAITTLWAFRLLAYLAPPFEWAMLVVWIPVGAIWWAGEL